MLIIVNERRLTSSKSLLALQSKKVFEVAGRYVITWLKRQIRSFFSSLHNQDILYHALLNNRLLFYIFRFSLPKLNIETRQLKQKCLHGDHTFNAAKTFSSGKLPTRKELVERVLYKDNWAKQQTSALITQELADHCLWCNVYLYSQCGYNLRKNICSSR